jgi:HisJ family histidinol phosphate phosphatase
MSRNGRCCDLHTHTRFSADSSASMEAMCRRAIELGLRQIAFTEHVDYVPADIGYGFFRPAAFLAEIARCRKLFGDRVTILAGVEVGELNRFRPQADELLASYPFDLVIGSLHWVDDDLVFESSYFWGRSEERAFREYFAAVEAMCRGGGFDVLGHMDTTSTAVLICPPLRMISGPSWRPSFTTGSHWRSTPLPAAGRSTGPPRMRWCWAGIAKWEASG